MESDPSSNEIHEIQANVINGSVRDYGSLTCYDKNDMMSMITFLFLLSASMFYILIALSIIGIILNLTGVYILCSRKTMKNTFNQLLVSLYCVDSLFLTSYVYLSLTFTHITTITTILSRGVKIFYSFAFKCSIFLTVGTSHERYTAMKFSSINIGDMNTERRLRMRLIKYIIPIIICAMILTMPEYLENEIIWVSRNSSTPENHGVMNER